jgi:uncharacterized protein YdeI (YjbR/CyaY-like superfamily)
MLCEHTSDEVRAGLPIISFASAAEFDAWLSAAPQTSKGLWLKIGKKGCGVTGISKPDAVDAALCHGWIDGQQDKYNERYWLTRFTPRKPASRWSQINRSRVVELIERGSMMAAGLAEIDAAKADGRWEAAYPPASTACVPPDLQRALDRSQKAARQFAALGKQSRYALLYRLSNVKRPETRTRLISEFVANVESKAESDFTSGAITRHSTSVKP